jgi:hypothetical protein
MQGLTYIQLKRKFPHIARPYKSPLGNVGAALTVIIALVTIYMQLQDPVYVVGVLWVAAWFAVGSSTSRLLAATSSSCRRRRSLRWRVAKRRTRQRKRP